MKFWLRFHRDERAVTAIEYALLAALIVTVIVGAVGTVSGQVLQLYEAIRDQIAQAIR